MFTSSTKREIRHFHVVVVQWRLGNVQKSVMHVQTCCFANLNQLFLFLFFFFLPFSLPSSSLLPMSSLLLKPCNFNDAISCKHILQFSTDPPRLLVLLTGESNISLSANLHILNYRYYHSIKFFLFCRKNVCWRIMATERLVLTLLHWP